MATNFAWQDALKRNRSKIVKGLANPDEVADALFVDAILTDELKDRIQQKKETENKTREILNILERRGQRSVKSLYNAFQQTANEELADLLIDYVKKIDDNENLNEPKSWPPTESEMKEMERDNVLKIKSIKSPHLHEYNKEDVYIMHRKQRGAALIINNTNFSDKTLKERTGSEIDVRHMTDLFQQLQFEVAIGQNLTAQGIVDFLDDQKTKVNWKETDCLVTIINSHGEGSIVFGTDGKGVRLQDLIERFSSQSCPDLDDKPRLFFVQACRSESKEPTDYIKVALEKQSLDDRLDSVPSYTQSIDQQEIKHPAADFLVAYATPQGTKSYRHVDTGSWFLSAVAWAFKYYAYKEELHHLLIRVNRIVARGKGLPGFEAKFTVSEVKSNLRKKFYFFPGVYGSQPCLID